MTQEPGGGCETGGVSPGVACETGGMGRAMSIGVVGESSATRGGVPTLSPQTPDSGGAQAGGASPPFTVCVHSWFEVFGGRRAEGRGWGGGGRAQAGWGGGSERDE